MLWTRTNGEEWALCAITNLVCHDIEVWGMDMRLMQEHPALGKVLPVRIGWRDHIMTSCERLLVGLGTRKCLIHERTEQVDEDLSVGRELKSVTSE